MSTLYVVEFADAARPGMYGADPIQVAAMPHKAIQQVTVSSSSIQSAAFGQGTQLIRLHTDVPCAVIFGTNPTASAATSFRMAPNQTEYFSVPVNASYKVAAITTT